MVDLSERIRSLRIARQLTQQQLADRVNVSKGMVSSYEIGIRMPSIDVLRKLSVALGVTTDYLLGLEKKPMLDVSQLSPKQLYLIAALVEEMAGQST